ncbi:MAG: T9SS type A sorting domain-containing protein [Bacteroidia bacterium]|nr:T9SS type A sorting domain-containing protein [Bacteroidia bacterium]
MFLFCTQSKGEVSFCEKEGTVHLPTTPAGIVSTQLVPILVTSSFPLLLYWGSIQIHKEQDLRSIMLVLEPLSTFSENAHFYLQVVSDVDTQLYAATGLQLKTGFLIHPLPCHPCISIHVFSSESFYGPMPAKLLWWPNKDLFLVHTSSTLSKNSKQLNPFNQTNTTCNQAACITNNLPLQNNTGVPNTPWAAPGGCWGITDNPLFYRFHIFDNNPVTLQISNITCGSGQSLQAAVYSGSCTNPILLSTANCNVNQTTLPLISVNGSNSQLHYTNMSPVPPPVTLQPGSYILVVDGDQNSSCTFHFNGTALQPIRITTNVSSSTISSIQCGQSLQFFSSGFSGNPNPPVATYSWSGPNGFSSNQQNPTIQVVSPFNSGTYTLTITVNGCTYTTTHFVNVTTPTSLSLPPLNVPCGQSINLNAPNPLPNAPTPSYSWTGPGGWSATGANVTRTCNNNCNQIGGIYTLTETYAPGCARIVTQQVNIVPAFNVSLTHNWTSCTQTQICFTAVVTPSQSNLSYLFSGPSWTPPVQSSNTICKTPASGLHSVTVTQGNGCQATTTLSVNPPPPPPITLTHNWQNCSQNQLCLTASGFPGNATYTFAGPANWNPPSQASNIICKNPPLHQGTYSVTVVANACTASTTVTIQQPQIPPFPHTFPPIQCGQPQLCFSVSYPTSNCPSPGHEWMGPGFNNTNKNQLTPCITPPNVNGTYYLKYWCGNCFDSIPWSYAPPKPHILMSGNNILCGQNVTFTALPPPNNTLPATYTWAGPCGFSATGTVVTHINPCSSGTYTLTMTTPLGTCQQTAYVVSNVLPTMSISFNPSFVRCNDNVTLIPQISHNAASLITSYNWSGPCGFSSTQSQPILLNVYSCHQGVYSLTVTLQNCTTNLYTSANLNVNPILPPTASANPNPVICGSSTVNFSASPGFQTYSWSGPCALNNPNTSTPTLSNPSNACSGTYTVNVTTNNGFCTSSATTSLTVNNIPAPSSSATSTICPGDTLFLTINANDPNWQGATFQWKKNNVVVANTPNHSFVPPNVNQITTETYTAYAILGACTTTTNHIVNIYPLPTPPLTFTSNQPICEGQTLHLTTSADNAQFYYWKGPNGFSATTSVVNTSKPNVTLADAGVYSVTRQLFGNPCKSNPITHTVVIHPLPSSPTAPNVARCGAGVVTFSATLGAGPTPGNQVNLFTVPNGGTVISFDNNPPYEVTTPSITTTTTFYLASEVTQTTCSSPRTPVVATILPVPTSTFTANSVCQNTLAQNTIQSTITFTGSNINSNTIFNWNCDNCLPTTPNTQGPHTLSWNTPGIKTLTLQTINPGTPTCSSPVTTVLVTVHPVPTSTFSASPNPICTNTATQNASTTVTFTGSNTQSNTIYTWNCDNCTQTPNTVGPHSLQWSTPGTKTITLAVSNPTTPVCNSLTTTVLVTVLPTPTATFTAQNVCANILAQNTIISNISFSGIAANGATFNWSCDGCVGGNPTTIGPHSLSWATAGTKTLSLQVVNPGAPACSSAIHSVLVTVNPVPTSSFSVSPQQVCASVSATNIQTTLTFNGTAQNNASYSWNCDGCVGLGQGQGPHSVSWANWGTKTITLQVINPEINYDNSNCTSTVFTVLVTVHPVPTSSFSATAVCQNQANANILSTIQFNGNLPTGYTYNFTWNCDNCLPGNPTTQGPHNLSWNTSGTKTLTLQVASSGTPICTSPITSVLVTVHPTPNPTFTVTAAVCTNTSTTSNTATLTFTGTAATGATFTWGCSGCITSPGNTQGPYSLSWTQPGTKTITLSVVNNSVPPCEAGITTATVTVHPTPTNSIQVSMNNICQNTAIANVTTTLSYVGNALPGAVFTWNCDGCSGLTQTIGPHIVSWSTAGTKTITLQVTNPGTPACTAPAVTVWVTVHPTPQPTFTATNVCENASTTNIQSTINFTGSAQTGAIYTWSCDACTPIPTNTAGPFTISWSTPGTKTLTLQIQNPGNPACVSTIQTVLVTVHPMPTSSLTATPIVCTNAATASFLSTLSYTGTNALSNATYTWSCDGCVSPPSSTVGPHNISWVSAGTKTLTLIVTNPSTPACTSPPTSVLVTVLPTPLATFTGQNVCENILATNTIFSTLTFTGTANPNAQFLWNCGGCIPSSLNGSGPHVVSWASAGTKTITLTVINSGNPACSSAVQTVLVTVNPVPTSLFTVVPNIVCVNPSTNNNTSTLTFTGTALSGATFTWNCDGCLGLAQTLGPHTVSWNTVGTKTITLQVTNPSANSNGTFCSSSITTAYVTVNPVATSNFTASNVCSNASTVNTISIVQFAGNLPSGFNYVYTWNCDGCVSGNPTTQGPHQLSWSSPGTKTLTLSVANNSTPACPSPVTTVLITVYPTPMPTISIIPSVCTSVSTSNNTATLSHSGSAAVGATFTWNCDGCLPLPSNTAGPFTISWAQVGVKTVTLAIQNNSTPACISTVSTALVTVNPTPTSDFNVSSATVCASSAIASTQTTLSFTGTALSGAIFTWNCNGCNGIGQGIGPHTVSWATPGTKTITLIVANPGNPACISEPTSVLVTVLPAPTSSFIASNVCVNSSLTNIQSNITFTGTALTGAQYNWHCDNCIGNITNTSGPFTVSWASVGIKTLTLQVINPQAPACSSVVSTVWVTVHPIPSPSFTSTPIVCTGSAISNNIATLTFTGAAETNATYSWNCDGCTASPNSTAGPFQVSWASCGIKTIQLTVTNVTGGCQAAAPPVYTTVHQTPNPSFSFPGSLCAGQAGVFQHIGTYTCNFATYIPTFSWACSGCSGFSPSLPGPINVSWAQQGTKTISLTVTLSPGNCSATQTQTVTVNATPIADFSVVSPVCVNNPALATFTGQSGVGMGANGTTHFIWNCLTCNVPPSNTIGPHQLSFSTPGYHSVSLQVVNQPSGCSSNVVSKNVQVIALPPAPVINDVYRCGPGQVVLSPTSATPPGHQVRWYNSPPYTTIVSTEPTYGVHIHTTTTFYVGYFNPLTGCETKSMVVAYVQPVPSPPLVNNVARCGSGSVTLTMQMGSVAGQQFHIFSLPNATTPYASIALPNTTYVTPVLAQNYTFYVATSLPAVGIPAPGCMSSRVPVQVIIHTPPAPPNVWGARRCGQGAVIISASMNYPAGDKIHIYHGNSLVGSAFSPFLTTLDVTTTTIFSVVAVSANTGCESEPQDMLVEVILPPASPQANSVARCGPGSVTITAYLANPLADGIHVYTQSNATNPILTVSSNDLVFGLGVSSTTTFYLEGFLNGAWGCVSPRFPVVATVNPVPLAPLVQDAKICGAGSVTFSIQTLNSNVGVAVYPEASINVPITQLPTAPFNYTISVFQTQKFYFEAVENTTGCRSPRAEAKVHVYPIPNPPFVPDVSRCGSGVVTFTPQFEPLPNRVVRLQHICEGGVITSTSATQSFLALPYILQTTTTFFVQVYDTFTGCFSTCNSVTAKINPVPSEPIASNVTVCPGTSATIVAQMGNIPGDKIYLYDSPTSNSAIQVVEQLPYKFTLGVHYLPTTYYLLAETLGCKSNRVPIQVSIHTLPQAPAAVPLYRCGPGILTFTITPATNTPIVEVYSQSVGGTAIQTLSQPPYEFSFDVAQTTTFYFTGLDVQTSCRSIRNAAIATILPLPPEPAPIPAERCGKGSGLIDVPNLILANGHVRLYTTPVAEAPYSMDNTPHYNLLTPEVETTTTFWLESYNYVTGCASKRVPVTLTIFPVPAAPPALFRNICSPGGVLTFTLQAQNPGDWARLYATQGSTVALDTALGPGVLQLKANISETTTLWYSISNYVNGNQISTCESSRVPIFINVAPLPYSPIVPPLFLCQPGEITFTIHGVGNHTHKLYLYEEPSRTLLQTRVATGGSFKFNVFLNQGRSFSLVARDTITGCKSLPTYFEIPILKPPAPPIVQNTLICQAQGVTFSFVPDIPPGDYIRIYSSTSSLEPLVNLYSAPFTWQTNISTTTTFYASSVKVNACESERVPFTVAVEPNRIIFSDTLVAIRCRAGKVRFVLPQNPEVSQWRIYANATASTPIEVVEGSFYITPFLEQNTDFYIAAYSPNWQCESKRFLARAIVREANLQLRPWSEAKRCGSGLISLPLAGIENLQGVWQFWNASYSEIISFSTPISSNVITFEVTQSARYFYRFIDAESGCTTHFEPLEVSIFSIPRKPNLLSQKRCGEGKVTFALEQPTSWLTLYYTDPTLQNLIYATPWPTAIFETPPLQNTTHFYAIHQDLETGCRSEVTELKAEIFPIPSMPAFLQETICGAGRATFTFSSLPSIYSYRVYDPPFTALQDLQPGVFIWQTPFTDQSRTWHYSIRDIQTGCESRLATLELKILPQPQIPYVLNQSICKGEVAELKIEIPANDANEVLLWDKHQNLVASKRGSPWHFVLNDIKESTTYYLQTINTQTGCTSEFKPLQIEVLNKPSLPPSQKAERCGVGTISFTFTISNATQLLVYSAQSTTAEIAVLDAGNSFSPFITQSTTFWVEAMDKISGCKSDRVEWIAIVNSLPSAPLIQDMFLCAPGGAPLLVFNASPSISSYAIYRESDAIPVAELANNDAQSLISYSLPWVYSTTAYYIVARSKVGGCLSPRSRFQVIVHPEVTPPQVVAPPICAGQTAAILVRNIDSDSQVQIRDAQNQLIASFSSVNSFTFTTPFLSQNTHYFFQSIHPAVGCSSSIVKVDIQVHPLPSLPTIPPISRCGNGLITLSTAIPNNQQLEIYNSISGGQVLARSSVQENSSILSYWAIANESYFVQVRDLNTGCISPRTPFPIQIIEAPPAPLPQVLRFCEISPLLFTPLWSLSSVPQGLNLILLAEEQSVTPLAQSSISPYTLTLPSVETTTTFYLMTKWQNDNTCQSRKVPLVLQRLAILPVPSVSNAVRCGVGVVTFEVNSSFPVRLLSEDRSVVFSQDYVSPYRLNSPFLTTSTQFYIETWDETTGCKAQTKVEATILPIPKLQVEDVSRCGKGEVKFTFTLEPAQEATILVYNAQNNLITSFTGWEKLKWIAFVEQSSSFYAKAKLGNCFSEVVSFRALIHPIPPLPTLPNQTICTTKDLTEVKVPVLNVPSGFLGLWVTDIAYAKTDTFLRIPSYILKQQHAGTYKNYSYFVQDIQTGCISSEGNFVIDVKRAPKAEPITSILCEKGVAQYSLNLDFNVKAIRLYDFSLSNQAPIQTIYSSRGVLRSNYILADHTLFWVIEDEQGCQSEPIAWNVRIATLPPVPHIHSFLPRCVGDSLRLEAKNSFGYSVVWTLPSGQNAWGKALVIPFFESSDNGLYKAQYVSIEGCTSQAATVVASVREVLPLPQPFFYNYFGQNVPFCPYNEVNFALANFPEFPQGVQFEWMGPNGFYHLGHSQPGLAAPRSAADNGKYRVRAIAGACTTAWAYTDSLIIHPKPEKPIIKGTETVCISDSNAITLTIEHPLAQPYFWKGPNNFLATANAISRPANRENLGVYSVVTQNSAGCFSDTAIFEVKSQQASFRVASYTASLCEGSTWQLEIEATLPLQYRLQGPTLDTLFSTQSIRLFHVSPEQSGIYTLTAIAGNCTLASQYLPLVVIPKPISPTVVGKKRYCDAQIPTFEVTFVDYAEHLETVWYLNSLFWGRGDRQILSFPLRAGPGSYRGEAMHIYKGCTSEVSKFEFEILPPLPPPTIEGRNIVCYGDTLKLLGFSSVADAQYYWVLPNGSTYIGNSLKLVPALEGTYSLVIAQEGCTSASRVFVEVLPQPLPPNLDTTVYTLCAGENGQVNVKLSGASILEWQPPNTSTWYPTSGNILIPAISIATRGVYKVRGVYYGCTSAVATFTVNVIEVNKPTLVTSKQSYCANESVHLSSLGVLGQKYLWKGPNGFRRETSVPELTFTAFPHLGGTYSLQIVSQGCTSATSFTEVVVHPIPATPIIRHNSPRCVGDILQLSVLPTNAGIQYLWKGPDFEAIGPIVHRTLTHTQMAGIYSVVAIVNQCTSVSATSLILIQEKPDVPQIIGSKEVCEGRAVYWAVQSGRAQEYLWQGPGGFLSNAKEVTLIAHRSNAGSYSVVGITGGCTSEIAIINLLVYSAPVLNDLESNSPVCTGNLLKLTAHGDLISGEKKYFWVGPGNFNTTSSISQIEVAVNPNIFSGVYEAYLVDAKGCTSNVVQTQVNVVPSLRSTILQAPSFVCEGQSISLLAAATPSSNYLWVGPGGFQSTLLAPRLENVSTQNSGVYSFYSYVGGCTSNIVTASIQVGALPNLSTVTSNSPLCAGETLRLTAPLIPGASYYWQGPPVHGSVLFSSNQAQPILQNVSTAQAGIYTVFATLNGCTSATRAIEVTISTRPQNLRTQARHSLCEGETLYLQAVASNATQYFWQGPSGFSSTVSNPMLSSVTSANAGQYSVVAIHNGCSSSMALSEVSVTSMPYAYKVEDISVCSGTSYTYPLSVIPGAHYQWIGPGGFSTNTASLTISSFSLRLAGTYRLWVTVNNCRFLVRELTIRAQNCKHVSELKSQQITVYPNPAKNIVYIDLSNVQLQEPIFLEILSSNGQLIKKVILEPTLNILSLSNIHSGIYLFKFYIGGQVWAQRLIIE